MVSPEMSDQNLIMRKQTNSECRTYSRTSGLYFSKDKSREGSVGTSLDWERLKERYQPKVMYEP